MISLHDDTSMMKEAFHFAQTKAFGSMLYLEKYGGRSLNHFELKMQ